MSTVPSGCLVSRLCTWQSVESRPAAREKEGRRAGRSGQPDRRALGTVSWETAPHRGYAGRCLSYNRRSARTRVDGGAPKKPGGLGRAQTERSGSVRNRCAPWGTVPSSGEDGSADATPRALPRLLDEWPEGLKARRPLPYPAGMSKPLWAPWRLAYVEHADELDRCIFCEPEDQLVVHARTHAVAVMNKFPYASGHVLIAPRRHVGDFGLLSPDEVQEVHSL